MSTEGIEMIRILGIETFMTRSLNEIFRKRLIELYCLNMEKITMTIQKK